MVNDRETSNIFQGDSGKVKNIAIIYILSEVGIPMVGLWHAPPGK